MCAFVFTPGTCQPRPNASMCPVSARRKRNRRLSLSRRRSRRLSPARRRNQRQPSPTERRFFFLLKVPDLLVLCRFKSVPCHTAAVYWHELTFFSPFFYYRLLLRSPSAEFLIPLGSKANRKTQFQSIESWIWRCNVQIHCERTCVQSRCNQIHQQHGSNQAPWNEKQRDWKWSKKERLQNRQHEINLQRQITASSSWISKYLH